MVQYKGVNVEEAIQNGLKELDIPRMKHILLSFLVKRKVSSVSLVRSQPW